MVSRDERSAVADMDPSIRREPAKEPGRQRIMPNVSSSLLVAIADQAAKKMLGAISLRGRGTLVLASKGARTAAFDRNRSERVTEVPSRRQ